MNRFSLWAGRAGFVFWLGLLGAPADEFAVPVASSLAGLSLEELMKLQITSVSKGPQDWFGSAAALDVITGEDIRRAGARHLADALRGSPGLAVARQDSHTWAISPRGFTSEIASKTLVLLDGRSVYAPLNGGVYWDAQDTLLEDLDRIEIIRGPGGSLWGANAVNGVINILTKSARDTQGTLLNAGGGTLERAFASARHGGQLGENAWFRVYGKYFERDDFARPGGGEAGDSWEKGQGGFRVDWDAAESSRLTFQGDYYQGNERQTRTVATDAAPYFAVDNYNDRFAGGNFLSRWTHEGPGDSEIRVQLYYDRTERESLVPEETRDTVDFEAQHRFALGEWNRVTWGLGYRWTGDRMRTNFALFFADPARSYHLYHAFVQDEVELVPDQLKLTFGTKFEHNDFTGWEVQPSARVAWTPDDRRTLWAAVSRAVRVPNRAEHDVYVIRPAPGPSYFGTFGNPAFDSETVIAYELGARARVNHWLTLDATAFWNDYDRLLTVEPSAAPFTLPLPLTAFAAANSLTGESYGAELAANLQLNDWWRLRASYAWLRVRIHDTGAGLLPVETQLEGNDAEHQAMLRSLMDLPGNLQFDVSLYYTGARPSAGVDRYVGLDLRLMWRACDNVEISLVGQDLLDPQHAEFAPVSNPSAPAEVPRSVYAAVTVRF
jgi:iron complex outermembrane receptor protein